MVVGAAATLASRSATPLPSCARNNSSNSLLASKFALPLGKPKFQKMCTSLGTSFMTTPALPAASGVAL